MRGFSIVLLAALPLLAACSAIDRQGVGGRVGEMNKGVAAYRNEATLLNIARASKTYPLNFVAISGVTGHNTLSLGIPVVQIPPVGGTTVTLGQGTDTYAASNDFAVNVVDDPATYVALHTPLDPATMAFFYDEGYGIDFFNFLFIDHIRVFGKGFSKSFYASSFTNPDPENLVEDDVGHWHPESLVAFSTLAEYGLTFKVEAGTSPGQQKKPRAKICFDPAYIRDTDKQTYDVLSLAALALGKREVLKRPPTSNCASANAVPVPPGNSPATVQNTIICSTKSCSPEKAKEPKAIFAYTADFPADGIQIEIYPRSVYTMYQFLGHLVNRPRIHYLHSGPGEQPGVFFDVEKGRTEGCAARANLDGVDYCVPETEESTLYAFNILHEITALYTASQPAQQANSSTVRITP